MNNNILLAGGRAKFEPHFSQKQELPFIFHSRFYLEGGRQGLLNLHRNVEILCITGGEGQVRCGEEMLSVEPGDMVVVNSYAAHQTFPAEFLEYDCLIVDSDFCSENGIDIDSLQFTAKLRDSRTYEVFRRVSREYAGESPSRTARIRSSVLELMICLWENHSAPKESTAQEDRALQSVIGAIDYIRENLSRRLSVEEIADNAGFSKFYFLRLFKKVTGCTLVQYINLMRCEQAKELLKTGKYTVKQTAVECGFDNLSYFTNVFKKYTGTLPNAVRSKP